jgi:hypothetical protein
MSNKEKLKVSMSEPQSSNTKEEKITILTGKFAVIVALISGGFLILNTFIGHQLSITNVPIVTETVTPQLTTNISTPPYSIKATPTPTQIIATGKPLSPDEYLSNKIGETLFEIVFGIFFLALIVILLGAIILNEIPRNFCLFPILWLILCITIGSRIGSYFNYPNTGSTIGTITGIVSTIILFLIIVYKPDKKAKKTSEKISKNGKVSK